MKFEVTKRPLRVAMVHYRDSATAGGSLRVGETIANHLDPQRISATMVFAYGGPGPVARKTGVPCEFIGASGPKDVGAWVRARSLFRELTPDVIHFQDAIVWLRTALAGSPARKLLHIHARVARASNHPRAHPFRASALMRAYLKFTDAQVCINNGARNALLDLGWIQERTSGVVYNSIEVERFNVPQDRRKARAELGLPGDVLLLGILGRLVWEKGCSELLSLIKRLPQRWHGVICGDGPLKRELQQTSESLGLSKRVHFIDSQDDVVPVYAALDAYAFLSHYEPFGLVLAEAMAARLPVFGIQSDGEFNEPVYPLFADGVTQLVPFPRAGNYEINVPEQILDRVARKVADFGDHPERYQNTIAHARNWVDRCFSAPIQAEAMTQVYEELHRRGNFPHERLRDFYGAKRAAAEASANAGREYLIAIR